MGKLGAALACLLFAVPFGGVGVFATWAIGSTLHEAWRAQEWVRVKASVETAALHSSSGSEGGATYRAEGSYRYVFQGKPYSGSRLGLSAIGGSDNIDDWHHEVNARLERAGSPKRYQNLVGFTIPTGFGQAFLHRLEGRFTPLPSEGGHVDFAARTPREIELLRHLTEPERGNHVSRLGSQARGSQEVAR